MVVDNDGNAPLCFVWELTVVASGSTVTLSNVDDDEPALVLTPVTAGHTIVVDGQARTVTDNGSPHPQLVAAGSGWPALIPGTNDVVVSGGTGTFTFTPLYL